MTIENTPEPGPSFGDRLWLVFKFFLRALFSLLVILIIIGGVSLAIYYGIPAFHGYFVQPVQNNTTRLDTMEALIDQEKELLDEQLNDYSARLIALEVLVDEYEETIATLQEEQESVVGLFEENLLVVEEDINVSLARLEEIEAGLDYLNSSFDELSLEVDDRGEQIEALGVEKQTKEEPLIALYRELQTLKAMELLTRSRLYLSQSDLGLAERDILMARDLLAELRSQVYDFQVETLTDILGRLDLAIENLPDAPDLAADDLEVAWQLLARGLPAEPAQTPEYTTESSALTLTPVPTDEKTPEETSGATETPAATITPTP